MKGEQARRREIAEREKCRYWGRYGDQTVATCFATASQCKCMALARAGLQREAKRVKRGALR